MTMALENRDYQKRSRDRRKAEGGKTVTVVLSPDETAALEKLKSTLGMNARDCIGKALLDAARRTK